MASTTFVDGTTPVVASWLNDVNTATYNTVPAHTTTLASGVVLKDTNTGAATIPYGTTAQRPAGALGQFRYNTNTLFWEGYNGTSWVSLTTTDYFNTTRIDVVSASTLDLTANAPNTRNINITGTTTITAVTVAVGQTYIVRFNAALILTNNANINTQTGANILTSAGDTCIIRSTAANTIEVVSYSYSGIVPPASITPTKLSQPFTQSTTTTLTGTSINFASVPSWIKRLRVNYANVSTTGSSTVIIQLGTSGGLKTSGYLGSVGFDGAGATYINTTTGAGVFSGHTATSVVHGWIEFVLVDAATNTWTFGCQGGFSSTTAGIGGGGSVSLAGTLTQFTFTTVSGADSFDAGILSYQYEG